MTFTPRQYGALGDVDIQLGLPNMQPVTPDPEFKTPTIPGDLETIGAAFRQENTIGSMLSRGAEDPTPDPSFDLYTRLKQDGLQDQLDRFYHVRNPAAYETRRLQIDRENNDRKTLDSAGAFGVISGMAASILDATSLVPGGAFYRGGRLGYSVARSALSVGAYAAGGTALQEGILQMNQFTRPASESAIAIGGSAILGGVLGGALGGLISRAELPRLTQRFQADLDTKFQDPQAINEAAMREMTANPTRIGPPSPEAIQARLALESMDDLPSSELPRIGRAAGAQATPEQTLEDLSVAGKLAGAISDMAGQARLYLAGRALNSPSTVMRSTFENLIETPLYLKKNLDRPMVDAHGNTIGNAAGEASAQAVETLTHEWTRGALNSLTKDSRELYRQYVRGGGKLSAKEFAEEAGKAARRGDIHDVAQIQSVAQMVRARLLDPLKNGAVEVGLLPSDVKVSTADSYFSRRWLIPKIEAMERVFKDRVESWARSTLESERGRLQEQKTGALAKFDNLIAEASMSPADFAKAMQDLPKQLKDMRLANASFEDIERSIREFREAGSEARQAGALDKSNQMVTRAQQLRDQAGSAFSDYITQRNALGLRIRRIREGIAGSADRVENARGKIVDGEQADVERLVRLHRALSKIDERIFSMSPQYVERALADGQKEMSEILQRSDARLAKYEEAAAKRQAEIDKLRAPEPEAANEVVAKAQAGLKQKLDRSRGKYQAEYQAMDASEEAYNVRRQKLLDAQKRIGAYDVDRALEMEDNIAAVDAKQEERRKGFEYRLGKMDDEIKGLERQDPTFAKRERELANLAKAEALEAKAKLEKEAGGGPFMSEALENERLAAALQAMSDLEKSDPWEAMVQMNRLIQGRLTKTAGLIEREGARMAKLAEAMKASGPEAAQKRLDDLKARKAKMQDRYDRRMETPDGDAQYAKDVADSIYDKLTGRTKGFANGRNVTASVAGPLKQRTFNAPDAMFEDHFLDNDIFSVSEHYARTMSADIELARKFGSPTMDDVFIRLRDQYRDLKAEAEKITDPVARDKKIAQLNKREKHDVSDLEAARDMVRGNYMAVENATTFAHVLQAAGIFTYITKLGGQALSSVTDFGTHMMAHGLSRFMADGVVPLVSNLKGVKMAAAEGRFAGTVGEVLSHARMAASLDLTDPYSTTSPFMRFMQSTAKTFTKYSGISYWTDFQKTISTLMTQTRILQNVGKDWADLAPTERAYMNWLGLGEEGSARLRAQFEQHGTNEGGVLIANSDKWDINNPHARLAQREFRAALNKEASTTIVTKGLGDIPLFLRTPTGKALSQFQGFAMASHQRAFLRGLQNGELGTGGGRFGTLSAFISMTAIGMFIYWAKSVEQNKQDKLSDNPGRWIAEGLDRSGLASGLFAVSNTIEKGTGYGAYAALRSFWPEDKDSGKASFYVDRDVASSLTGPSGALLNDLWGLAIGLKPSPSRGQKDPHFHLSDNWVNTFFRTVPFASLPVIRSVLEYGVKPAVKDRVLEEP